MGMSKYKTGAYLIIGFDDCGTKVFTRVADSQTHFGSMKEGYDAIDAEKCHSFATIRVQHNSKLRDRERWCR